MSLSLTLGIIAILASFAFQLWLWYDNRRLREKNIKLQNERDLLKEHYDQTTKNIKAKDKINAYVDGLDSNELDHELFNSKDRTARSGMPSSAQGAKRATD